MGEMEGSGSWIFKEVSNGYIGKFDIEEYQEVKKFVEEAT